jgi:hypothetical protein
MDVPADDGNVCTTEICKDGVPDHPQKGEGQACSGQSGVCDMDGACVACLQDADCVNGTDLHCHNNECFSCADGIKNGDEVDKDCGGACGTCANGKPCTVDSACTSMHCVDTVCCDLLCDADCIGCNEPGSPGECTNLGKYTADPTCPVNNVCDGSGNCRLDTDQPCTGPNSCASGKCVMADGGLVCKKDTNHPCTDSAECASGNCMMGDAGLSVCM